MGKNFLVRVLVLGRDNSDAMRIRRPRYGLDLPFDFDRLQWLLSSTVAKVKARRYDNGDRSPVWRENARIVVRGRIPSALHLCADLSPAAVVNEQLAIRA